jgi:hypothetical protein
MFFSALGIQCWVNRFKLYILQFTNLSNKLECLSLSIIDKLVLYVQMELSVTICYTLGLGYKVKYNKTSHYVIYSSEQ